VPIGSDHPSSMQLSLRMTETAKARAAPHCAGFCH
jgi:hypothetical protein